MNFFKRKVLGIDIGTDAVKVAEVSAWGKHRKLENYSEIKSYFISKEPLLSTNEEGSLVSAGLISLSLKEVLKEAKIKTKRVIFPLPDFLTFAASFEIPPMPEKEIASAVYYNASRYLTLPISEVTLDWKIINNNPNNKDSSIKVFLIAVPNQVIKEYQKIARDSGLELYALEPEVFGVARALVQGNKNTICMIDMGAGTSTINIIDNGFFKRSYSSNFSGNQLSTALSSALNVQLADAEKIKIRERILPDKENTARILKPLIDNFFSEVKNVSADFLTKEQKQISGFFLTGGTAILPGLKDYFSDTFKIPVSTPNCFLNFAHPKIIEKSLSEMSPRFSAAVGAALCILEI